LKVVDIKRSHLCARVTTESRALILSYPSALDDQQCKILSRERERISDVHSHPYLADVGTSDDSRSDLNVLEPSWFRSCVVLPAGYTRGCFLLRLAPPCSVYFSTFDTGSRLHNCRRRPSREPGGYHRGKATRRERWPVRVLS